MKRHLNTSYRLVWNHITGTLVVASELARSRGKRTGVADVYKRQCQFCQPVVNGRVKGFQLRRGKFITRVGNHFFQRLPG